MLNVENITKNVVTLKNVDTKINFFDAWGPPQGGQGAMPPPQLLGGQVMHWLPQILGKILLCTQLMHSDFL